MSECAMQFGQGGIAEFMQMTQDVSFRLREIRRMALDVETHPVRGAVDAEDEFEAHPVQDTRKGLTAYGTISYITLMNYRIAALGCVFLVCLARAETRAHVEPSIVLHLPAPPSVVFPLFGPNRESEWAPDWKPEMLYPADGSQKAGAVFTTKGNHRDLVWVLATYDEAALKITYVIVKPGARAGQLDITLSPFGNNETEATVTHRMTSLAAEEDASVKDFGVHFPLEREHWERAISARLRELTRH